MANKTKNKTKKFIYYDQDRIVSEKQVMDAAFS